MKEYVIALDQGTTSSRAVLVNHEGSIVAQARRPLQQIFPRPGWVEHNPQDILSSQLGALTELLFNESLEPGQICAIGITNQRETTIVWNRETGEPIANAIGWQCRRTAAMLEELCASDEVKQKIREKTGLIVDPYFSASKIKWILDTTPGARDLAEQGKLAFGTVDCWLTWVLTNGQVHATDVTNASRTMLYNIHEGCWDPWLLELFDIPLEMLPDVRPSASDYGVTSNPHVVQGIPIRGVAGDQQAALFGHCGFEAGSAKNTYGTGCFLLMNTGDHACISEHGLLTTIAASAPGVDHTEYALEGSVFISGALIQWLRDELGLIESAQETEELALSVPDTGGVYVVPAFTGLGAPYWDTAARGSILGITRGTNKAHVVRACLEAMAYQVLDLAVAMENDAGIELYVLNVDGGASENRFLMQFQADIMDRVIRRPANTESTAMGAAYLAGLNSGFWKDTNELRTLRSGDDVFSSKLTTADRHKLIDGWHEALRKTMS